jgi:RNA polymerase sigma-70 factor (ECF subfamily)
MIQESHDGERALDDMLYEDLHRLARRYMRGERRDHTLQPTALVHEAYLRLAAQRRLGCTNRAQFIALAAVMMRRSLMRPHIHCHHGP